MDLSILGNSLSLAAQITTLFVGAALLGAVVTGMLRAATAIDDEVISFTGKLVAVGCLIFFSSGYVWSLLIDFANRLWGGADFYI